MTAEKKSIDKNHVKNAPVAFNKLDKIKYKAYYKSVPSKFYNTTDYETHLFYKKIANI